jgi:NodT family efflux transporter outer membrane factor (OMF) lipoprotein
MSRNFACSARAQTKFLTAATAAFALGACAPSMKSLAPLADPSGLASEKSFAATPAADWPSDHWWEAYGDSQLNTLIEEALKDGPSLKAAAARVQKAEAMRTSARGPLLPSVSAGGNTVSTEQSLNMGFPDEFKSFLPQGWNGEANASLSAQYELDFFGKNRAAFAAATSQAQAARAEEAAARLQLSTAVALAYADLSGLSADRAALESVVRLREDSASLVRQRAQQGLENEGVRSQADSEAAAARSDLAAIDAQIARTRNRIAALLGAGPDRALDMTVAATPAIAALGLPANLGADLVGRRPDIVAARARAEANARRIQVARAAFYPNVSLTGLIGHQSLGLDLFGDKDSEYGAYGPAISLPIFQGGRLRGQYSGARADYEESVALYTDTLADALRDVADALADRRAADAELVQLQAALDAAENSYRIARLRYDGGLATYLDVLQVENSLVARRRAVSGLRSRAFSADVALVRALGGGYVADAPKQIAKAD